jgi:hypothetical protein
MWRRPQAGQRSGNPQDDLSGAITGHGYQFFYQSVGATVPGTPILLVVVGVLPGDLGPSFFDIYVTTRSKLTGHRP